VQSFNDSDFTLNGSSSGAITLHAAAAGGTQSLTFPNGTTDFSSTGGTSQVVKQTSSGAALTVARLACADLSDSGAGCSGAAGSGTVNSGTTPRLAYYATSGTAVSDTPNATITAGALALGASGTAGSVAMGNATSGTVTLQPVTGALGSVTASLPANTGTIAELNLAQTFSATQTFGAVLGTGRTVSGTSDTLAATDCGTVVEYTSGSAVTTTTLASIASGSTICSIGIYQHGAGQVTISDGSSATHVSFSSCTKTAGQYALMSLAVYAGVSGSEYNVSGQCS
jgi:hypothetical protein